MSICYLLSGKNCDTILAVTVGGLNMYTFDELKSFCKADGSELKPVRLALLGDCATQHLAKALRGTGYVHGYNIAMFDADYNQISAQVLDASSELYAHSPDFTLIFMCAEKLYDSWCDTPEEQRAQFAETTLGLIVSYWNAMQSHTKSRIIQYNFIEHEDNIFGSFGARTKASFRYQLKKLNLLLGDAAAEHGVYIADIDAIAHDRGRSNVIDDKLYYIAKMPFSTDFLPYAAECVFKIFDAVSGRFKKCCVLDLDNTLWGGVIGDDGLDGIEIGELGRGHAFTDLQKWLKELKKRGILLAVCSKNNEDAAKEPFLKHPEMVLRLEDFSIFVANWQDKASNIRTIQQVLNIGMDSLVFIDDNPFERNTVRSLIPDITVPELPEDPAEYLEFLKQQNLFETASYSVEDAGRTDQYRAEAGRVMSQASFGSFDEYLQSLDMVAEAKPFDEFHFPRIAQLTQRSNQFNLRTVRYSEDEIAAIAASDSHITLYFTLKDKFGDNGLISVVILDKCAESTLFVSEWLMSCRVLKRGMEEFIINTIVETARKNGYKTVIGEYIKTAKNAMVADIYERLGFTPDNGRFVCNTDNFIPLKTFIKSDEE